MWISWCRHDWGIIQAGQYRFCRKCGKVQERWGECSDWHTVKFMTKGLWALRNVSERLQADENRRCEEHQEYLQVEEEHRLQQHQQAGMQQAQGMVGVRHMAGAFEDPAQWPWRGVITEQLYSDDNIEEDIGSKIGKDQGP